MKSAFQCSARVSLLSDQRNARVRPWQSHYILPGLTANEQVPLTLLWEGTTPSPQPGRGSGATSLERSKALAPFGVRHKPRGH